MKRTALHVASIEDSGPLASIVAPSVLVTLEDTRYQMFESARCVVVEKEEIGKFDRGFSTFPA